MNFHIHAAKLKSKSLLYAVFVSFFISVILGTLIMLTRFHSFYLERTILEDKLTDNVNSAILLVLSKPENYTDADEFQIRVFEETNNLVTVKKRAYGAYLIIEAEAEQNKIKAKSCILAGCDIFSTEKIAIYLPDQNNELKVCGTTKITGNCYLPSSGVETSCIGTNNYLGDRLVYGESKKSSNSLPEFNPEIRKIAELFFSGKFSDQDSVVSYSNIKQDAVRNSFKNKVLVIKNETPCTLTGNYAGNIIIASNSPVHIAQTAYLEDIIIYAPYIEIEKGFVGKLQMFAKDSINISDNVQLQYPSFTGVFNEKSSKIHIGEKCEISGSIAIVDNNFQNESLLITEDDTKIYGLIYNTGSTCVKSVYGSVYTNHFVSNQTYSETDKLEDVIINAEELSPKFCGGIFFNKNAKNKQIKCLN